MYRKEPSKNKETQGRVGRLSLMYNPELRNWDRGLGLQRGREYFSGQMNSQEDQMFSK